MRSAKYYFAAIVLIMLLVICSCTAGGTDLNIEISQPDKSLVDLASKTYDEADLSELAEFNGLLNELNTKCPIECLRKDNGVLLFDSSGNKILGNTYRTQLLKSDFNGLAKGQSLDAVRAIDPNGEYLFLYTGRNDTPKESLHYTKDGYLITIQYDASCSIISINEELI